MHRRDVLRWMTLASVAAWRGAPADETTASVKPLIGFSLYGMRSLAIPAALTLCREIGYQCVELPVLADWPCDPATLSPERRRDLKQQFADGGLPLVSFMENLPLSADDSVHRRQLERLERAAEWGHELSPTQPPLIETVLGGARERWADVRDLFLRRLTDWAALGERTKTVIAIKPHVGNALHEPQAAAELVAACNSRYLRLVFDYSHYAVQQISAAAAWQACAEQTVFIHLKDVTGTPEKFRFLLPGEGTTDYGELSRMFRAAQYAGPIVVEVSAQIHTQPDYDPAAAARRSFAGVKPLFS